MQEDRKRVLPKPGNYTGQYSATMLNRGGQQYHRTLKSQVFKYRADAGTPAACELHGWPQKLQLGTLQTALLLQLTDRHGNSVKAAAAPTVHLSCDQLEIRCEVGQWKQTADGTHQLHLTAVEIRPLSGFQLPGPDQAMTCDVKLLVTLDRGLQLTKTYETDVAAGKSALSCESSSSRSLYGYMLDSHCHCMVCMHQDFSDFCIINKC